MHRLISGMKGERAPVRRLGGERYLLTSLVTFAATVIVTRLFLELTGYPQVGNGTLHIAHVLWGGLLLFISGLLPLVLANNWAYMAGAVLNGMGVGLFIDEVGKFITRTNDYFYPPAAPIIYAFFVLVVLFYMMYKRRPPLSPRLEMYAVLHDLTEVLDQNFEAQERKTMIQRLKVVLAQEDDQNILHLARALLNYLESKDIHILPSRPSVSLHMRVFLTRLNARLSRRYMRTALIIGLSIIGFMAIYQWIALLLIAYFPTSFIVDYARTLLTPNEILSVNLIIWFTIRLVLEGAFSTLLILASGMIIVGKERQGVYLAVLSLVTLLTTVNLLVFYFDQFEAVNMALARTLVLFLAVTYRQLFLPEKSAYET